MLLEHYNKYQEHPEGRWIISIQDCERLQSIVKKYGCKTILDLGSGIGASTYALAEATEGRVWAIEQFKKCSKIAREILPEELKGKVEFIQEVPGVMSFKYVPYRYFSSFTKLPEAEWDLIVVDGPGPFMSKTDLVKLPNGDVFNIFHKLKTGCLIYVDQRMETVFLMERYFYPYFDVIEDRHEGNTYHLFQRNKVKFCGFADLDVTVLKYQGYFDE